MSITNADKEEIAAQVLAVIKAKFQRPDLSDTLAILKIAEQQASALLDHGVPSELKL
jgi:hypothetical protein